MSIPRALPLCVLLTAALTLLASPAPAQLTLNESGFVVDQLSNDAAKQVELGIGPDTCVYYGSDEGLHDKSVIPLVFGTKPGQLADIE